MKVAFIGAGNMGAHVANSPADAVRGADVVITMLANDHAVREAMLESKGIDALARVTLASMLETMGEAFALAQVGHRPRPVL
jgi:3-hydroxyisobutyrate dehydrogenase-like beta-hydroxyacid dehydrogenase